MCLKALIRSVCLSETSRSSIGAKTERNARIRLGAEGGHRDGSSPSRQFEDGVRAPCNQGCAVD
jgi:hypothetical protein